MAAPGRRRRIVAGLAAGIGVLLAVLVVAFLVLTRTDWGLDQLRRYGIDRFERGVEGRLEIRRVEGDVLGELRLVDVVLRDPDGQPILEADTVATRFALRALLRQRIDLTGVRLVRARVLLDQPPGRPWNFARVLPDRDPDPAAPPGWGAWVRLRDVTIIDSHLTIRSEWRPDPELTPEERGRKIAEALGGETRADVRRVPGGFQSVMEFRALNARLPDVLLADPEVGHVAVQVAALSTVALPFRPPAAHVRDLAGRFHLSGDSLWFDDVRARLPGSTLAGAGAYHLETGDLDLRMRGAPAAFADLRWLYPELPEEGGGPLRLTLRMRQAATTILAEEMELRLGAARLAGDLRVQLGDTVRLLPTDVRFAALDTRLVERLVPDLDLPRHGTLDGRLAAVGTVAAMEVDGDVAFHDERAGRSRVLAAGTISAVDELRFTGLRLELRPLRTDLLRDEVPRLPPAAAITGTATLTGTLAGPLRLDADLALDDPATGRSRVAAAGTVDPGDGALRFADLRLRFAPLQADLLRAELPELPPGATLTGPLRLDGSTAGLLRLDGELALADPATGTSRAGLAGALDLAGELAFRSFEVRPDPLQVELLRRFQPDLPLGGTLAGTAMLDGRPGARLAVTGDLTHREAGELSRVAGRADIVAGQRAQVSVRVLPLSLVTAGRFAPGAGLRGAVTGTITAAGNLADLAVAAELDVAGGGALIAEGTLDLASPAPGYDLDARVAAFDLAAVTVHAPATTALTGALAATGRGTEPATMRAEIRADLVGSAVDGLSADELRLRLGIAAGLARVDSSVVRLGATEAWADGSFGLIAGRHGELRYRVRTDTLALLAPYLPPADTGVVEPRPAVRRAALAETRARAYRVERRRLVERIATGREPPREELLAELPPDDPLRERPDTPPAHVAGVPRDAFSGRIDADGVLAGNVVEFDATGRVAVEELAVRGHYVREGTATFALLRRGRPEPALELDADARGLLIEGYALDSASARIRHRGEQRWPGRGAGRAVLAAHQADGSDYRADVEFTLALDRGELRLHQLELDLDTVTWRSVRPGVVAWHDAGVELRDIELRSDDGALIALDGRLAPDAASALDVTLRQVDLAHVAMILQDDVPLEGRVDLDARLRGPLAAPLIDGTLALHDAARDGEALPDVRAAFAYEGLALSATGQLLHEGRILATAEARLPLDLSLADRGPLLAAGALQVDIQADSLALELLGPLTDELTHVRGFAAGDLAVRGSWESAVVAGTVLVEDAAFRVAATGVRYEEAAARLRFDGSTLFVDSLVARSGGPIRVTGQIDLSAPAQPVLDLELQAENAWAVRNGDLELRVDAELDITGPVDRIAVRGYATSREGVVYIPERRGGQVVDLGRADLFETLDERIVLRQDTLVEATPLLARLDVDLRLEISPDTWVRSTEANVEVQTVPEVGPLRIQVEPGTGRLTVVGTVNSNRGEYSFMSRRFQVTRGAATFIGAEEPDPLLQVTAEHEVRLPGREPFALRVLIGGTLLEPTLTLESTARPPIAQTDLFTYVAFGRSAGSLLQQQASILGGEGGPAGDLVGNVAGLATQQMAAVAVDLLLTEFEREMARELGLDVFHVAPADLPSELFTGRFTDVLRGTEIEAGRYIGRRLFASVRLRPTFETRPGALVEYRTRRGLRVLTSIEPRFLSPVPTLDEVDPIRTSVLGAFIFREWRF
jgi:translocation and assembly module TamB